jgi:hypothetical protein
MAKRRQKLWRSRLGPVNPLRPRLPATPSGQATRPEGESPSSPPGDPQPAVSSPFAAVPLRPEMAKPSARRPRAGFSHYNAPERNLFKNFRRHPVSFPIVSRIPRLGAAGLSSWVHGGASRKSRKRSPERNNEPMLKNPAKRDWESTNPDPGLQRPPHRPRDPGALRSRLSRRTRARCANRPTPWWRSPRSIR